MSLRSRGLVIWLTGLSGAGKSTIAALLAEWLRTQRREVHVIDGDELRRAFSSDLGFNREDREKQNQRATFLADTLTLHHVDVIVSLISPYRASRDEARRRLPNFIEVFVNAPLSVCVQRDPKGLYHKALAGGISDMTGLDAPYERPIHPDVVVETARQSPRESVEQIIEFLEQHKGIDRRITNAAAAAAREVNRS